MPDTNANIPIDPTEIPSDPETRRAWVIEQLLLRGLSLNQLARRHGTHRSALSLTLRVPSLPSETILADALGLTPAQLFPERYDEHGRRRHRTRPDLTRAARNSSKDEPDNGAPVEGRGA
ncbi:MAG: helix-turn-helix domain-containing protein [bacterium]